MPSTIVAMSAGSPGLTPSRFGIVSQTSTATNTRTKLNAMSRRRPIIALPGRYLAAGGFGGEPGFGGSVVYVFRNSMSS